MAEGSLPPSRDFETTWLEQLAPYDTVQLRAWGKILQAVQNSSAKVCNKQTMLSGCWLLTHFICTAIELAPIRRWRKLTTCSAGAGEFIFQRPKLRHM